MANKLELTWVGKENRPRLEPRILIEEPDKSYHAKERVSQSDIFDNRLIFGDNLLALKALEHEFSGRVKCVYIDPPFNTGQAFEHYDDGIEHSLWLSMMRDRLEILRRLLREDGSIWVHVDDNEQAYLKVMMDEIFGRRCFVANVVWEARYSRSNDASLSLSHNHILVYASDPELWKKTRNRLARSEEQAQQYKDADGDPRGPWRAIPWDAPGVRQNLSYPIKTPSGATKLPPPGRHWSRTEDQWEELVAAGLAYFGKNGDGSPSYKSYLSEASGIVPNTWWAHEDTGNTDEAKKEGYALFGKDNAFDTPKPERLMQRIIAIATNPGDIILDSFGGSGTTGAVAHKMGRRWIMAELGEHCYSHIWPRLVKVVDGNDPGGISSAVKWAGGGGFRFFRLAPSLLQQDQFGNPVINKAYNPEMLAEAMCKLEGFNFEPSNDRASYWMHGRSSESDFIYVTTQTLSREKLAQLSEEVGHGRTLLVCCGAFHAKDVAEFENLTVKKIPKAVLTKCEWGRDDYSLEIAALPKAPEVQTLDTNGESASGAPKAAASAKGGSKKSSAKDKRRTEASILGFGGSA